MPRPSASPAAGPGGSRALGRRGEELAAAHYRAAGFEVLARNWRCDAGEIDLVCRSGTTVVVCEVKARSSASYGVPAEAVGRAKQARLRRLAARYLAESGLHGVRVRFDVVSVLDGALESYVDAF